MLKLAEVRFNFPVRKGAGLLLCLYCGPSRAPGAFLRQALGSASDAARQPSSTGVVVVWTLPEQTLTKCCGMFLAMLGAQRGRLCPCISTRTTISFTYPSSAAAF